jgi:hypothetical protein
MDEVRKVVEGAIEFYNARRPHASINFRTPLQAKKRQGVLRNRWKKKSKKGAGEPAVLGKEVKEMPTRRGNSVNMPAIERDIPGGCAIFEYSLVNGIQE